MDYDSIIRNVGGFGRYQILTCIYLWIGSSLNAITSYVLNFIFTSHSHRCQIPEYPHDVYSPPGQNILTTINGTTVYNISECTIEVNNTIIKCNSWVYDQDFFQSTLISKFDIVCEDKFYRAHFLMVHYFGLLIGSISCGFLSDNLGRRGVFAIGIAALLLSTAVKPLIDSFGVVTFLEFFNGYGSMVCYIAPFVMVTELVGPNKRLFVSFGTYFSFCIGNYILLPMVYFIRDWTYLMWIISAVIAIYCIGIFFVSESPRWLLSRGRKDEAMTILKKIAKVNKRSFQTDINVRVNEDQKTFIQFIKELLRSKLLMRRLIIISLNWFALNLIYFGISMNVARFGGDIYINFAASTTAETLAILVCWFAADRLGRKKMFCGSMICGGIVCLCTIFTSLYAQNDMEWLTTTLAMIGKFCVSIAFFVAFLFTAELFPTVLRASAVGFGSMAGRIGSISSAYIAELGTMVSTKFGNTLPLIIYGAIGLMAGLWALTLPETSGYVLPELVKDAKIIKRTPKDKIHNEDDTELVLELK